MTKDNNTSKKKTHPACRVFWLTFLVLSVGYACYSFYTPTTNIDWIDDVTSTEQLTENSKQSTMLFFTGKWCSPCRIMKREVFADEEVEKVVNSCVTPVIIDIDNPFNKEIVDYYEVSATPTTVFIDNQGQVLDFAVGKISKTKLLDMIRNIGCELL